MAGVPPAGPARAAGDAAGASFQVDRATVRFGGLVALDEVSLTVAPGTVHGVIGPNGAGKTTLFNVVCGFLQPSSGTLRWRGEQLTRLRPHQLAGLGIARTLQGVGLFRRDDRPGERDDRSRRAGQGRGSPVGVLRSPPGRRVTRRALQEPGRWRCSPSWARSSFAGRLPRQPPVPRPEEGGARPGARLQSRSCCMLDEPAAGLSSRRRWTSSARDDPSRCPRRMSVMLVEHHMDLVMSVCDADHGARLRQSDRRRSPPSRSGTDPAVLAAYLGVEVDDDDDDSDALPCKLDEDREGDGAALMLVVKRTSWSSYGAGARPGRGQSRRCRPGKITAVLGANGAGKTTLLRTVSGLVRSPRPARRSLMEDQRHHPGCRSRQMVHGAAWPMFPRVAASSPS